MSTPLSWDRRTIESATQADDSIHVNDLYFVLYPEDEELNLDVFKKYSDGQTGLVLMFDFNYDPHHYEATARLDEERETDELSFSIVLAAKDKHTGFVLFAALFERYYSMLETTLIEKKEMSEALNQVTQQM